MNQSITDRFYHVEQGQVNGGYSYTRSLYYETNKRPLMEKWIVSQMTHKWSGGSPNGSYTDDKGPSASVEMLRFFMNYKLK
jgi:poly(3-hydroxybutyrate) depolymerase